MGPIEPLKMRPIGCPETLIRDYPSVLRNIPEERRYYSFVVSTSKFRTINNSKLQHHGV
jgi:hypothetical protein